MRAFKANIEDIVCEFGYAEITLLGRNSYDINFLSKENTNGEFAIKNKSGEKIVESKKYPNLKICIMMIK